MDIIPNFFDKSALMHIYFGIIDCIDGFLNIFSKFQPIDYNQLRNNCESFEKMLIIKKISSYNVIRRCMSGMNYP